MSIRISPLASHVNPTYPASLHVCHGRTRRTSVEDRTGRGRPRREPLALHDERRDHDVVRSGPAARPDPQRRTMCRGAPCREDRDR